MEPATAPDTPPSGETVAIRRSARSSRSVVAVVEAAPTRFRAGAARPEAEAEVEAPHQVQSLRAPDMTEATRSPVTQPGPAVVEAAVVRGRQGQMGQVLTLEGQEVTVHHHPDSAHSERLVYLVVEEAAALSRVAQQALVGPEAAALAVFRLAVQAQQAPPIPVEAAEAEVTPERPRLQEEREDRV